MFVFDIWAWLIALSVGMVGVLMWIWMRLRISICERGCMNFEFGLGGLDVVSELDKT